MVRRRILKLSQASGGEGESGTSSQAGPVQSSLRLSNVIQLCAPETMKVETSVIAVPGYGTPPVPSWDWKAELEKAGISVDFPSHLHMYIHQPAYSSAENFTWESFLKAGSDLAEDLAKLSNEFPQRPIILIAHSLGGVLLKKALLLAHQNPQDPRFKLVLECLSGILFLGTPHSSVTDKDTLLRHNQVLYSCARIAKVQQPSRLPAHDVYQLANLAASFEQIANIPLLSVFEHEKQPSGVQRFFGKGKKPVVDEQLATISSHAEQLLGVHLSHRELCKLPRLKDQSFSARDFLRFIFVALAANERWNKDNVDFATIVASQTPQSNPLNPLNLAPIELDSRRSSVVNLRTNLAMYGSAPPPYQLPARLNLVSNNAERLLGTRKWHLPCFMPGHHLPNPDFVGREDVLSLMDKHLLPQVAVETSDQVGVQRAQFFALCGMGGIGKTDIAVEYIFSRRSKFGAILWIDAAGVSQLSAGFGRIATQLGLQSPDEVIDLESSKELAKAWLGRPRKNTAENESWLLILDNADTLDIVTDYVPYNGNGSVLITSRDPSAKSHFFHNGNGIDLEPLPRAEAATLLRKLTTQSEIARNADEQNASMEIAAKLDGLPLAMTQMAGFIRRRHLSIREFADLYSTDARYGEIHDFKNPAQRQRYGYTLATVYNFEGFGPHAMKLLQLLAFLNPDRVREDIFLNPQSSDSYWTASTFESARFELLASSVIRRNIDKKELWIHRVIQAEIRSRMNEAERYRTFNEAILLLGAIWPPGDLCTQASKRWVLCEELLPHLERFHQLYTEHKAAWESFDVDPAFPTLLNEAAVYLHERGFSHEGKPYLKLALAFCKRANITQEPLVSGMHLTMGALSNETNDAQACLEHNILCLKLRKAEAEKNNKPDVPLAFAHSQMGIAYVMVKKFALATEYFKQCIEMLKGLDADVDDFGFPVCNLGLAYWIQGELDMADKTLTDLLLQREKAFGKLDMVSYKTGRVLQALGNVKASKAMQLEAQNDHAGAKELWDESFAIHTDCLKQYESTLGKCNHRTADACHKLAEHHIRRKEHTLAQDYLDRALSIWGDRQWFRNESARSSFLRGTHLLSMGGKENTEKGRQWVERARLLRRQIVPPGEEEPKVLQTIDFDDLVCFWSI